MIRRWANPLALATATVVFLVFYVALASAGPVVQLALPAVLAAAAATGVWVMLGRTPAQITDDAYHDDAEAMARQVGTTLDAVSSAARTIRSPTVRADVAQIAKQVPELVRRTREEAPTSLYSTSARLNGHLQSLHGVVTRYAEIEAQPTFYPGAHELLTDGEAAVRRFKEFTLKSIQLINSGGIADYRANLDTVAPPSIPTFGGDQ
ncbi:hypothetical protein [Nigerium massiliense]|uniref:hypothetical protein n=1 Tax=Nigerium massiliense TaxID=1522317 RepID=UPI0005912902|nr:hypothetical protein [Nigerium massiliense]